MNIYIDESGSFVKPQENKCAISSVGALILPENKTNIIFSKFESLKNKWEFKDTEVKGRYEQRTQALATDESTFDKAAAEPVDQQTQKFVQEEELEAETEDLRVFQDVLKNDVLPIYQARVVKQPEILANAAGEGEGQQIVFEVDTNSFNDTRRVNANFRPISFGTSFGGIF